MSHHRGSDLTLSGFTLSRRGDTHRVAAEVDGVPVWFESDGTPLAAAPEALGTAFLVPALLQRRRLALAEPACPRWLANMERLVGLFRQWWGTPEWPPAARAAGALAPAPAPGTVLCFSGGVDSFHTLLRAGEARDLLLAVHGFDVPLADGARMGAFAVALGEISSALGSRPLVVRTNLREHPLLRITPWERTHGGALAAVGHLLAGEVGRMLISSSISLYSRHESWGSHWKSDPLWSSSRLQVVHVGEKLHRSDKLRSMAGEPLVQRHLRVCWQNLAPTGNCSRCEKCLHAMLVLRECGVLDRCTAFEGGDRIVERLDALPRLKGQLGAFDHLSRAGKLEPAAARAVGDLIRRTRYAQSAPVRARRAVRRALDSWLGVLRGPRSG